MGGGWSSPGFGPSISEGAEQALGTLTWGAGVAPSGTITKLYRWIKIGSLVLLALRVEASVAGTTVVSLSVPLPADCPTPTAFTNCGASNFNVSGSGGLSIGITALVAGPNTAFLGKDGSSAWTVYIYGPSLSADTAFANLMYFV